MLIERGPDVAEERARIRRRRRFGPRWSGNSFGLGLGIDGTHLNLGTPKIKKQKDVLTRALSLKEQYEKMLDDFEHLLDIADVKLNTEVVLADLVELRRECKRHKDFFAVVHQCHSSLDAMALMTDRQTRIRHADWHASLKSQATRVLDKATHFGQVLEGLVIKWTDIDTRLDVEIVWLLKVQQTVTGDDATASTTADEIKKRLDLLKKLSDESVVHKPHIEELMDAGQEIHQHVQCPALVSSLTTLRHDWHRNESALSVCIERFDRMTTIWTEFETTLIQTEQWIEVTNGRLRNLMTLLKKANEGTGLDDDDTRTMLLQEVWDIQVGAGDKISAKDGLSSKLDAILKIEFLNEPGAMQRAAIVGHEWNRILDDLRGTVSALEKTPLQSAAAIRNATRLVESFVDSARQTLDTVDIHAANNTRECELVQTAYANLYRDMRVKGKLMDVINFSLDEGSWESESEADDDDDDRRREEARPSTTTSSPIADGVSEVNRRWHEIKSGVTSSVQLLDTMRTKQTEFDELVTNTYSASLARVQTTIHLLCQCMLLDHSVVSRAVRGLEKLAKDVEQLRPHVEAIESFEATLVPELRLPILLKTIRDAASTARRGFDEAVEAQLRLRSALLTQETRWSDFLVSERLVLRCIVETRYTLDQFSVPTIEVSALESQCQKLHALKTQFKSRTQHLERLCLDSQQLVSTCDPEVADMVLSKVSSLDEQWKLIERALNDKLVGRDALLNSWLDYVDKYEMLIKGIGQEESQFQKLLSGQTADTSFNGDQQIEQIEELKRRVSELRNRLAELRQLSTRLESYDDQMVGLMRGHLCGDVDFAEQKIASLENDTEKDTVILVVRTQAAQLCDSSLESIKEFLSLIQTDVDTLIDDETMDQAALENALSIFKSDLNEFSRRESIVASFQTPSLPVGLSSALTNEVASILQLWNRTYVEVFQKYQRLLYRLLVSLEFAPKVERLRQTLVDVETVLRSPHATSLPGLLVQNKSLEVHRSLLVDQERFVRDEELMLGHMDDDDDGIYRDRSQQQQQQQEEVGRLESDWGSAIAAIDEKKSGVECRLRLWTGYKQRCQRFASWLDDRERERLELQVKHAPIKKVEKVLHQIDTVIASMQSGRSTMSELQTVCITLCVNLDDSTSAILCGEVARLQQRIGNMEAGLFTWHKFLQRAWHKWTYCDRTVADIRQQLKDMRKILTDELPTRHAGIVKARNACEGHRITLDTMRSQLNSLLDEEQELREIVSPEDVRILHQRVLVVKEMWLEIGHLLELHRQSLDEKLHTWRHFELRCRRFDAWTTDMEQRLDNIGGGGGGGDGDDDDDECVAAAALANRAQKLEEVYAAEMARAEIEMRALVDEAVRMAGPAGTSSAVDPNDADEDDDEDEGGSRKSSDILAAAAKAETDWRRLDEARSAKLAKLKDIAKDMATLDAKMRELCAWLNLVEVHLSRPVVYQRCVVDEIQRLLDEQSDVQRDIEQHRNDVDSVASLCRLLLTHRGGFSADENASIERAADNLAQKWEKINASSMKRKCVIDNTWLVWQQFLSEHDRLDERLADCETRVARLASAAAAQSYASLEDGLRESNQILNEMHASRKVVVRFNKRYHQLAKENRLDVTDTIKRRFVAINDRYDILLRLVLDTVKSHKTVHRLWTDYLVVEKRLSRFYDDIEAHVVSIEEENEAGSTMKTIEMAQLDMLKQKITSTDDDDDHGVAELRRAAGNLVAELAVDVRTTIADEIERLDLRKAKLLIRIKLLGRRLLAGEDETKADVQVQVDTLPLPLTEVSEEQSMSSTEPLSSLQSDETVEQEPPEERFQRSEQRQQQQQQQSDVQLHMRDMEVALEECRRNMALMEASLDDGIVYGSTLDTVIRNHEKLIAASHSSVDLVTHISDTIGDKTGLPTGPPYSGEVDDALVRWATLEILARQRERDLAEANKCWQRFNRDLDNVEQWMPVAEAHQFEHQTISKKEQQQLCRIEKMILVQKELLLEIDSRKAVVMSLNLCSETMLGRMIDKAEAKALGERVKALNGRWEKVCENATDRQNALLLALLECRQLRSTVDELSLWIESAEATVRRAEPVDVSASLRQLRTKLDTFLELKTGLDRCEPRVGSLMALGGDLLVADGQLSSSATAQEHFHRVSTVDRRIRALQKLCDAYLLKLNLLIECGSDDDNDDDDNDDVEGPSQRVNLIAAGCEASLSGSLLTLSSQFLESGPSPSEEEESTTGASPALHQQMSEERAETERQAGLSTTLSRCRRFLSRVVRTSLPIQALMLLLLGIASLIPLYEEDFQCALSNNFARSLEPMLQYRNGPPPT